ncbi:Protein TMC-2, partial [Aphelenchoides avenae]
EIAKIVTTDLVMTIGAVLVIDFLRGLWVRYCTLWWCWSLETTFPEYGEFKVAENVLHLVNNQGMIWLGTFFVPMLPFMNTIKLIIIMYIRGWACMTCNMPARQIFRASRNSNFYLILLLLMFLACTFPVGYVIASKTPSKNCGPFGGQEKFYDVLTNLVRDNFSSKALDVTSYFFSPGIIVPVMILFILVIYFLYSLVRGLKEANSDLSKQLMHERTEEKKEIFKLAGGGARKHHKHNGSTPMRKTSETDKQNGGGAGYPVRTQSFKGRTTPYQSSDDDLPSPLKSPTSPTRYGSHFLPSLQSVDENEDDEPNQRDRLLKDHDIEANGPPVKFTWKQRILICTGLADPEKLKRQMEDQHDADEDEKMQTVFRTRPPRRGLALEPLEEVIH